MKYPVQYCLEMLSPGQVLPHCEEEISSSGPQTAEAKLLRATFFILTKQQVVIHVVTAALF